MTAIKFRNPSNPTEWLYVPTAGPVGPTGAPGTNGTNGAPGPPGPPGDTNIVELTQAAYDALGTKDSNTLYVITDGADRTVLSGTVPPSSGQGINGDYYIDHVSWVIYGPKAGGAWPAGVSMTGGAGGGGGAAVTVAFTPTGGIASTNVQAAIAEVDSEKVSTTTAINTTAPLTGGGVLASSRTLDIATFTTTIKGVVPPPVTTTGRYLRDDGTWNVPAGGGGGGATNVVELTQAAYDALVTKDPATLYVITDGADRTLLSGTAAPTAGVGINGDYYINYSAWLIHGPKAGGVWPAGVAMIGDDGEVNVVELTQAAYDALGTKDPTTLYVITDGADRTVLAGPLPPTAGQGINGDFYINNTDWQIYGPKAGGAWPAGVSLIGPAGEDGLAAAGLPPGGTINQVLGKNSSVDYDVSWRADVSGGGAGVTDGDKGDIVVSGSGATWLLDPTVVTAAAKTVLDDANTGAMLTTLGAQPANAVLTDLAAKYTPASAAGPASLKLAEDTDNGTNTVTLTTAAAITSDVTATFPNSSGTVVLVANVQTLSNKSIALSSNTLTGTIAEFNTAVTDADLATATDLAAKISGGNGATTLWKGTQAQYDAIGTKDSNTVYVVT